MDKENTDTQTRILAIGAHPDDYDINAGGCAILWAQAGYAVRFVSVANGDAGHHEQSGEALAKRRKSESAGQVAGIEYQVLDNLDGHIVPSLEQRWELLRVIRDFRPDLILTHRPNDYHPDHRYTSQLVQDCSYLMSVPNTCPDAPRLEKTPGIAYFRDTFQKPIPFKPDVAVNIDSVVEMKIRMLSCHESQFYEWLPWIDKHGTQISEDPESRFEDLRQFASRFSEPSPADRALVAHFYSEDRAASVSNVESFEICEYGAELSESDIKQLFPIDT